MVEKVKECVRRFPEDSIILPHRIKTVCGIDENQTVKALKTVAPTPGKWVDIGAKSKLTRCQAWCPWLKINEWFYDEPGDEYLPLFPRFHDITSKNFPLVHATIHGRLMWRPLRKD
jgi:epoxyqueuosine reductase QueG